DDVVAYQHGEKPARILSSSGFQNLTLRTYEGLGHYTIPEESDEICCWLSEIFCLGDMIKIAEALVREYKSNTPDESSDDAGNLENSHFLESRSIIEEDTQIKFSKPSSMECETEDSIDNSNIQADSNHRLLKFVISGNNLLDQTKSSSTKVVLIFLESVEILMSVAKKVHMQLQNAEFQIQADMGSITSLNKSKRKHVEEVLQEKQQHLSSIYERCKEEVTRHLQDCKSTLQSLEAHDRSLLASTCEG
ncbi:hypothetical protein H5410_046290, partial [Solanum commersonii]